MGVKNLDISQNSSKISEKLKEKLKTQGKISRIWHLIAPYMPKKWPKKACIVAVVSGLGDATNFG